MYVFYWDNTNLFFSQAFYKIVLYFKEHYYFVKGLAGIIDKAKFQTINTV